MKFAYLVAAIFAAVFEHRLMEALSSARLFASEYGGYRHASIEPTILAAIAMLVALALIAYRDRESGTRARDWLVSLAERGVRASAWRAFASVLGLQLATLFAMESIEQFAALGHLEGGASFLGGPVAIGLFVAILVAIGVSAALRMGLRAIVSTVHALVRACAQLGFFFAPPPKRLVLATLAVRSDVPRVPMLATRSGLRAPPHTR